MFTSSTLTASLHSTSTFPWTLQVMALFTLQPIPIARCLRLSTKPQLALSSLPKHHPERLSLATQNPQVLLPRTQQPFPCLAEAGVAYACPCCLPACYSCLTASACALESCLPKMSSCRSSLTLRRPAQAGFA